MSFISVHSLLTRAVLCKTLGMKIDAAMRALNWGSSSRGALRTAAAVEPLGMLVAGATGTALALIKEALFCCWSQSQ